MYQKNPAETLTEISIIVGIISIIVLKIMNVITIPWIWLLSPIWILFLLGCIFAVFYIGIIIIRILIEDKRREKNERCKDV